MKALATHPEIGEIMYEESFWTGRKALTINGTRLTKIDKTHFAYSENDQTVTVTLKGSIMTGVTININGQSIAIIPKPEWYVLTISILMFAFVVIWGSSPSLCEIFPMIGGALGGIVSALFAMTNILITTNIKKPILKLLVSLGFFAIDVLACYIAAVSILVMFAA